MSGGYHKGTSHGEEGSLHIPYSSQGWKLAVARTAGSLVKDGQGRPTCFVGVAEDVTDRKSAADMLRASEEGSRTYINNSPTGVFVTDSNGTICGGQIVRVVACSVTRKQN